MQMVSAFILLVPPVLLLALHNSMYCGINKWAYFQEKSILLQQLHSKKGGGLISEGGPILEKLQYEKASSVRTFSPAVACRLCLDPSQVCWYGIHSRSTNAHHNCTVALLKAHHNSHVQLFVACVLYISVHYKKVHCGPMR